MTTPDIRILIGFDGSDDSMAALEFAATEAAVRSGVLHIVYAVDDTVLNSAWGIVFDVEAVRRGGLELLERAREIAHARGVPLEKIETECLVGQPAAVLSRLGRRVVPVEGYRTLAEAALDRFGALGYGTIEVVVGDGFAGVPEHAPYDRILVTAAAETIPRALVEQLVEGGIMVVPLGPHDGVQIIVRLTKRPDGLVRENLIPVRFVPLLPGRAREL